MRKTTLFVDYNYNIYKSCKKKRKININAINIEGEETDVTWTFPNISFIKYPLKIYHLVYQ